MGGGIAGSSAAAGLAPHGRTIMLEAEDAFGYHSSGRSATYYHFGIGNSTVRGLTAFSRRHFESKTLKGVARSHLSPALFVATSDMLTEMDALRREMGRFTDSLEHIDEVALRKIVPVLKSGDEGLLAGIMDHSARRLDSDALLQDYRAALSQEGGKSVTNARVASIERKDGSWVITTTRNECYAAPVLVNAAGAWCDHVAGMAGVEPLELKSLRRTIISIDAPPEHDARSWPFTKTVVDDFYMLPESGRLLACPVDEVPSDPTDAQPEDYDIALAAAKVEEYTSIPVRRIAHKWAGLRTFTRDRVPVAGFAPDAAGFFWLAGQGGYGLQTAPAMSAITEALITGAPWPDDLEQLGVTESALSVERLKQADKNTEVAPPEARGNA
ncbi:FAD-binding oxidoreductase [Henriciella sp.]|uniref:NAD(P)/FAD-dependent oxidoreductase n=1 Tax=Henriciella sp. TaxID=1968823 RepID=UPI002615D8BE|nr:FAD-binding oxidoreductase [Henriciella sp.]